MRFTWLGELEQNSRSQNKNENRKMNQKEWSLSINCPQKIKMVVLNQKL